MDTSLGKVVSALRRKQNEKADQLLDKYIAAHPSPPIMYYFLRAISLVRSVRSKRIKDIEQPMTLLFEAMKSTGEHLVINGRVFRLYYGLKNARKACLSDFLDQYLENFYSISHYNKGFVIGSSNFKQIFETRFIDKSLAIETVIQDEHKILLINRPPRFGKSSMISMLKLFFDCKIPSDEALSRFKRLKINDGNHQHCFQHLSQYWILPISFLSLSSRADSFFTNLQSITGEAYRYAKGLYKKLPQNDKKFFDSVAREKIKPDDLGQALATLAAFIYKVHQKKVFVFLDEYDLPLIHAMFDDPSVLPASEVMNALKNYLTPLLNSEYVEKVIITGVCCYAESALFEGIDDRKSLGIYNGLSNDRYAPYIGLSTNEVKNAYKAAKIPLPDRLHAQYGGYHFGQSIQYNTWSVLGSVNNAIYAAMGKAENYSTWLQQMLSSSSICDVLHNYVTAAQWRALDALLQQNQPIVISIRCLYNMPAPDDSNWLWVFLYFGGYLTWQDENQEGFITLKFPNLEIANFFKDRMQYSEQCRKALASATSEPSPQLTADTAESSTTWNGNPLIFFQSDSDVGSEDGLNGAALKL